jgi:hypothetical protein
MKLQTLGEYRLDTSSSFINKFVNNKKVLANKEIQVSKSKGYVQSYAVKPLFHIEDFDLMLSNIRPRIKSILSRTLQQKGSFRYGVTLHCQYTSPAGDIEVSF